LTRPYTPELFATIEQNSIEKAPGNQPLNPDVLPLTNQ
jgi:hypothetical protein